MGLVTRDESEALTLTGGFRHTCGRTSAVNYSAHDAQTCPACLMIIVKGMPENGWTVKDLQEFWDRHRLPKDPG